MECIVETANYYDHNLSIFDCDVGCASLKCFSVRAFGTSMSNALVHLKSIWVHWLNCAACLVAEVEGAFVLPLWLTRDATREAESFPIGINNLEAS